MTDLPSERVGFLVIRAWAEGLPPHLLIRLSRTKDVATRNEETTLASGVDEACDIVRGWLTDFERSVTGK